jgi:hypothetical protein
MSLRKAEQELDKTEKKYHDATKEVELARQSCDAEMCRVRIKIKKKSFDFKFFCRVVIKCKQWNLIELMKWKNLFKHILMQYKYFLKQ